MRESSVITNHFVPPKESDIYSTEQGWAVPIPLEPDELFSSWFARAALANGSDPLAFADAIWPKWRIWITDIDREIPQERLECLARSSGMSGQGFAASTLRDTASIISSEPPPRKNFWCWILAVGARNRKRSGGLQYCPACLAEDRNPYFRIHWRFAWHTVCEKHGYLLLDRCQGCGAAIQPHRVMPENGTVAACPVCSNDLRDGQTYEGLEYAAMFQLNADGMLAGRNQLLHGVGVTVPEWFAIARLYWDLVRRITDGRTESLNAFGTSIGLPGLHIKPGTLSIETARTKDRHDMLGGVNLIVNLSGDELKAELKKAGVTLQAFCPSRVQLPCTLAEVAFELKNSPVTRTKGPKLEQPVSNTPKPRKTVERMMRRLINRVVM